MLIAQETGMSRRIGTFKISRSLIHSDPGWVLWAMAGCLVIRAEYLFDTDVIVYTALCADFDALPQGCVPPEYRIVMHREESGGAVAPMLREWVKC